MMDEDDIWESDGKCLRRNVSDDVVHSASKKHMQETTTLMQNMEQEDVEWAQKEKKVTVVGITSLESFQDGGVANTDVTAPLNSIIMNETRIVSTSTLPTAADVSVQQQQQQTTPDHSVRHTATDQHQTRAHATASAQHTTAASQHTTASAQHTTAASQHTTASAQHTTASAQHTTASAQHTTASVQQTTAASQQTTAASQHTTASAQHTTSGVVPLPQRSARSSLSSLSLSSSDSDDVSLEDVQLLRERVKRQRREMRGLKRRVAQLERENHQLRHRPLPADRQPPADSQQPADRQPPEGSRSPPDNQPLDPAALVEDIKQAAAETAASLEPPSGLQLHHETGLYYDHHSGYYWDRSRQMYYDGTAGYYLSYDTATGTYSYISHPDAATSSGDVTADCFTAAGGDEGATDVECRDGDSAKTSSLQLRRKCAAEELEEGEIEDDDDEGNLSANCDDDGNVVGDVHTSAATGADSWVLTGDARRTDTKSGQHRAELAWKQYQRKNGVDGNCSQEKGRLYISHSQEKTRSKTTVRVKKRRERCGKKRHGSDDRGTPLEAGASADTGVCDSVRTAEGCGVGEEPSVKNYWTAERMLGAVPEPTPDYGREVARSSVVESGPRSPQVRPPPWLRMIVTHTQVDGLRLGSLFVATVDGLTVGREPSQQLSLDDTNISKYHAVIGYSATAGYHIRDLGSRNGTFVDGHRISAAKQESPETPLPHGCELRVGSTCITCHVHEAAETCLDCEPGQVQAQLAAREESTCVSHVLTAADVREQRRHVANRIKQKYGLRPKDGGSAPVTTVVQGYTDRASGRRKTKGSDNPFEKTETAHVRQAIPLKNKGFKLLQNLGWKEGTGLGKSEQGIVEPVLVEERGERRGFGSQDRAVPSVSEKDTRRTEVWQKTLERFNRLV